MLLVGQVPESSCFRNIPQPQWCSRHPQKIYGVAGISQPEVLQEVRHRNMGIYSRLRALCRVETGRLRLGGSMMKRPNSWVVADSAGLLQGCCTIWLVDVNWCSLDIMKTGNSLFTIFYDANYDSWLVVWNINFIFPYIGFLIIPIDELIFFRGVGFKPPTRWHFGFFERGSADMKWFPQLLRGSLQNPSRRNSPPNACPSVRPRLYDSVIPIFRSENPNDYWIMIWCDMISYDVMWCTTYNSWRMICYVMLWYAMICYDMLWYAMICYDMLWYAMICYDMLWWCVP